MCLDKIGKIFLVVVNIAFFLGGGALLAVGLISIIKEDLLYKLTNLITGNLGNIFTELKIVAEIDFVQLIKTNAIIICVVGGFLFALGFLGMCGACRMNSTCLMIYSVIVLVLLVGEVGLGVYAYMNAEQFEEKIQIGLRLALTKTYVNGYRFANNHILNGSQKVEELGFDSLQIYLQCCGVSNKSDWLDTAGRWNRNYTTAAAPDYDIQEAKVPPSCCAVNKTDIKDLVALPTSNFDDLKTCMTTGTGASVNKQVCYDSLRKLILDNQTIIIVIFVIIVAVEIAAVSCGCYLKGQAEKK